MQEQLSKQRDLYKRKEELVSTLTTGISSTGAADGGYNAQLAKAKTELNEVSLAIKKIKHENGVVEERAIDN